jgi:hypothetical protein
MTDWYQLARSYTLICPLLTMYDSGENPFLSAFPSTKNCSALSLAALRYVTCSYLIQKNYNEGLLSLLYQTRAHMLQCLQGELMLAASSQRTYDTQVLLAIILYGIATAWDGSDDLGVEHYNAAVAIFNELVASGVEQDTVRQASFFRGTLIYWWMGLCFSPRIDEVHAPPDCFDPVMLHSDGQVSKILAHPVAGVSSRIQLLLGKVAALVLSGRQQQRRQGQQAHAKNEEADPGGINLLPEAQQLEEALLATGWPTESTVAETRDPETPVSDLIVTVQVYRSCALILLYRAFPSILDLRLDTIPEYKNDWSSPLETKRHEWLQSLAMTSLDMLEQNSPKSGTKGYEQIPLVTIAGELRLEHPFPSQLYHSVANVGVSFVPRLSHDCTPVDCAFFSGHHWSLDPMGMPLARAGIVESSNEESTSELGGQHGLRGIPGQNPFEDGDRQLQISLARLRILERIKSVHDRLPVNSVGRVQEFVTKLWREMDLKGNIFWVDLILENGWSLNML